MRPICYHSLGLLGISLGIGIGITVAANAVFGKDENEYDKSRQGTQKLLNILTGIIAGGLYYDTSVKLLQRTP